jgi:hypothetical protein
MVPKNRCAFAGVTPGGGSDRETDSARKTKEGYSGFRVANARQVRDFLRIAATFTGSSSLFGAFSFNRSSCFSHAVLLVLARFMCDDGEVMRTGKRNP